MDSGRQHNLRLTGRGGTNPANTRRNHRRHRNHLFVVGTSGSGRSTALRVLARAVAGGGAESGEDPDGGPGGLEK